MARKVPKTTIVDIAAASGVSIATVSRIINGKPDVADETRERVLRVMDEIGFAPQSAWRAIRSGRSELIGVHAPQDFNPPNLHTVMAAALGVEEAGYSMNFITRPLPETELLGLFRSRKVDGMILLEILVDDPRPQLLRDHGFPFVMVGRRRDNTGLSFVDVDVEHGIDAAMDHLVGLGHRAISLLTFNPKIEEKQYGFMTWAIDAYARACLRHGLTPVTGLGGITVDEMTTAAFDLIDRHPEVTAFIAPQEPSVVGLLRAAQARGLRIPDDISLVAMLGETTSELATPPLTTIAVPADELGSEAARILLETLAAKTSAPRHLLLRPTLIPRGSSAPAGRTTAGV